jgi:arabinofuranosyltransferase
VLFFPFTAEDAFITYRYAANLATLGELVFNAGERILALTSPLHGMLSYVVFRLTGEPVITNKVVSLALLLIIAGLVYARYRHQPLVRVFVLSLMLLPPCVLLWTVGGLETPVLLFFVTSITLLAIGSGRPGTGRLVRCAGPRRPRVPDTLRLRAVHRTGRTVRAVAIRIRPRRRDRHRGRRRAAARVARHQPRLLRRHPADVVLLEDAAHNLGSLIHNAKYVLSYLVFIGVIPAAALVLWLLGTPRRAVGALLDHARQHWWLYCGIGAQLLYGLTMATTHMMFSFRYFVPYIPAAAILLGDLLRLGLAARQGQGTATRPVRVVIGAVVVLVLFQAFQVAWTYRLSVNGLARLNRHVEYRYVGAAEYVAFIDTLRRQGDDIRRHWESLSDRPDRLPRVFTYAAGVVPYTFRESYVYETLVSYRHCTGSDDLVSAPNVWMRTAFDLRRSADYIHLLTPRHGSLEPQLPFPEAHYELVSSHELTFDASRERFLVFFNPEPEPHRLAPRIDGGCP